MTLKNQELKTLISRYKKNSQQNINPLSMALNGVIDAAVMGGITNYTKVSIPVIIIFCFAEVLDINRYTLLLPSVAPIFLKS